MKVFFIFFLIIFTGQQSWKYFPENFSSLEYLINDVNNLQQYFLVAFYPASSNNYYLDKKNGIKVFPITKNDLYPNECINNVYDFNTQSIPSGIISNIHDNIWSSNTGNFPPRNLLLKNYLTHTNNKNLFALHPNKLSSIVQISNEIQFYTINDALYNKNGVNGINYFWTESINGNLIYSDSYSSSSSCTPNNKKIETFSSCTDCIFQTWVPLKSATSTVNEFSDTEIIIGDRCFIGDNGTPSNNVKIHMIKVGLQIDNNLYPDGFTCSNNNECPPTTFCDIATGKCENCDKRAFLCTSKTSITKCGRFTKQWNIDPSNSPKDCIAEFFNLNVFDKIEMNITPIKSGAATLSFWFFLTSTTADNKGIIHFVVQDYFVVSIFVDQSIEYNFYITAYQMYHKAYGKEIETITNRDDFLDVLNQFPYKNWSKYKKVSQKKNRWLYCRFGFNTHISKANIFLSYLKEDINKSNNNLYILEAEEFNLDSEYIYNNDNIQSDIHAKRYYRQNEQVRFGIYGLNTFMNGGKDTQIYLKSLYIFSTYIPAEKETIGFQYIQFETNIAKKPEDFPELVFALPLDSIDYVDNKYDIYYINPIGNKKSYSIISENVDDKLYDYHIYFYRLVLIQEGNKMYSNDDLDTTTITCNSPNLFCYDNNKPFICKENNYAKFGEQCKSSNNNPCGNHGSIGKGASTFKKGLCLDTCSSRNCNNKVCQFGSCAYKPFTTQCSLTDFVLFDDCQDDKVSGSIYYSYFYNLPPMKIQIKNNPNFLSSFYIQFDFLYETNKVIRHDNINLGLKFKNKKLYILITDSFRIWHDYRMTYIGIEDNNGHISQNIRPFFNLNNYNQFTISVDFINGLYRGRMYLNGNKANSLSFAGNKLTYILFCHLDNNCELGNKINWTSGYYRTIRIWDKTNNQYINDYMVYNSYIIDSYYNYILMKNSLDKEYMNQGYTTTLPLNLKTINDNILSTVEGSTSYNININPISNYNDEYFQLYNFNDKQELTTKGNLNSYIDDNSNEQICNNECQTCYGSGNLFSEECNTCDPIKGYYKNSNCESYPSNNKGYYALILPNQGGGNIDISITVEDKITITFWMKLIGFKQNNDFDLISFGNRNIYLIMSYDPNNSIIFFKENTAQIIAEKSYLSYLGQYIHFSISYFKWEGEEKSFLSIQINKEDLYIRKTSNDHSYTFNRVTFHSNYYATFTKFYIYKRGIIGGYAYNTNTIFDSDVQIVQKIIDESVENCVNGQNQPNVICIQDYDIAFNKDNYLNTAYPDQMKVYLTENDDYKIENCNENCATFCYNKKDDESACSCTSDSEYNYLLEKNNFSMDYQVKCKKLDYIDINRLDIVDFSNIPCNVGRGILEFWVYFEPLVKEEITYTISFGGNNIYIKYSKNWILYNPYWGITLHCKNVGLTPDADLAVGWNNIICENISCGNKITIKSDVSVPLNTKHSFGLFFIRQLRFWNSLVDRNNYINIKYINIGKGYSSYEGLQFTIDSIINSSYLFQVYPSSISQNIKLKSNGDNNFSYYPTTKEVSKIHFCEEDEECVDILKINKIKQLSFDEIKPSGNSRYTIETWIKIEGSQYFLSGINLVWEKHISLSILTDSTTDQLTYICFPQDYLTSPKNLEGRKIIEKADSSLNIDKFTFDSTTYDNKWVYVRCGYNWDNELYYIMNDNSIPNEKHVNKENVYPGMKVDYPFKYLFNDYEFSKFMINYQDFKNKKSDVIISIIRLYSEYLPPQFSSERVFFTSTTYVSSLELNIDFSKYKKNISPKELTIMKRGVEEIKYFYSNDNDYETIGKVMLCEPNVNYYNPPKLQCQTNICNIDLTTTKIANDCKPLECQNGYYLDFTSLTCTNTAYLSSSNRITRAPGSNENTALLNYECSSNHIGCNFVDNYPTKLICNPGFVRVGYKCYPSSSQETASFYFNRCYNFFPIYKQFPNTLNIRTKEGYAIEFSFKFDKVNEFCDSNMDRYVFWAYPHILYQKAGSDDVYYEDQSINYGPILLSRISLYEWNYIIIRYQEDEVSIFINMKLIEPDISYSTAIEPNYNIKAIAFCNGNYQCEPLGTQLNIDWTSAYYSHIRIYNLKATNIYAISEYALKRVQSITTSILVYYLFNNINNDLNKVYNELDHGDTSLILNFNLNIPIDSVYRTTDQVLMYSSTANFDWGEINQGKYVTSVEQFTGIVTYSSCSSNCARCYNEKSNNCYQCKIGYTLYNNECRVSSGYYMQIPDNLKTDLTVNFTNDNFDITIYNPITITIWIKFYGIKRDFNIPSINPNSDCILLIKISIIDQTYLCYNRVTDTIALYYNLDTILYDDSTFMKISGAWALVSFSNYNSKDSSPYYPNIFSFSFNGNTIKRQNTYNIPSPGLSIDTLIFGYGISGSISDIRIYNTFIMNPYGIITNSESTNNYLVYNKLLYSNTIVQCVSSTDFDINISNLVQCYEDYNLYHDKSLNCNNDPNQMLTNNGCKNCIEECSYCGGESKLNCACYYNNYYWFRKDKITNQVYCQRLPYHDFNIYSQAEFSNLETANTNEYAIEFWYFIYEYDKSNILFNFQEIKWTNHIKIQIYNENGNLIVDCYPISDKTLKVRDDSHSYFKWNHVICGTNLKSKKYYLNNLGINKLNDDNIIMLDTLKVKSKLSFINENGSNGITSHGVFLIKEMKLWSIFSVREFPTDCIYKENDASKVPYLLHYFPLTVPINGELIDSQGNKATSYTKKNNIIGYNLVDYNNLYNIDDELEECLLIFTIPSMGYFNLTNFLIQVTDNIPNLITYDYTYYISEEGEKYYSQINQEVLITNTFEKEYLINKLNEEKYKDSQLNIYVKARDINSNVYIGFGRIEVINYEKGKDVDYSKHTIGIEAPIKDSITLNNDQIWNRLYVLNSLGYLYDTSRNDFNITLSLNDYYYKKVNIYNPECNEDFCSYQGKCYIVVRSLGCLCNYGYSGANCHMTNNNKEYLTKIYNEYWNLLTSNSNYDGLVLDNNKLNQILYLVKAASSFVDVTSSFFTEFFNFVDYLQINKINLYISNYEILLETFNYILFDIHNSINSERINRYNETLHSEENISPIGRRLIIKNEEISTISNNDLLPNTNLSFIREYSYQTVGTNLISSIRNIILSLIKNTGLDYDLNFTSFDITVKSIDSTFDYESYFIQRKSLYKSYFDGSNCQQYIFSSASHAKLFLVIIEYKYNPLSYHSLYSNSASYLNDVFFSTPLGTKVDIMSCPNSMNIYFPINLYDTSKIDFITEFQSSYQTMAEGAYNKNDPYVTYPSYVFDNGEVSHKTRLQRINEWSPRFMLNCSYFDNNLKDFTQIKNISVSEDYYIRCGTNHLSAFTIEGFNNDEEFPIAGLFFYLKCPQVFKCGSNYRNVCFVFFIIFLVAFVGGEIYILLMDFSTIKAANLLDNIKIEIIKENRMIYTEKEIMDELIEINKLKNQKQLEKDVEFKKSGNEKLITIKEKEQSNRSLMQVNFTTANPPKRAANRTTNLNLADPFTNQRDQYVVDDNIFGEGNGEPQPRYRVQDYRPNKDLVNEGNEYFDDIDYDYESINNENNNNDNKENIKKEDSEKEPKTPTKLPLKDHYLYGKKFKDANLDGIDGTDNESDIEDDEEPPIDYFQKFTTVSGGDNIKNNNFTLPEKYKKVTFVNEIDSRKNIPSFYQDIDNKDPNWKKFFLYLSLRRNVYLSPFTLSSTLNPRWKRMFILYIYILLQFFYTTIFLSLIERTGLSKGGKVILFSFINLIASNITIYPITLLFRVSTKVKNRLFNLLKSFAQMKLILEWKTMKKKERKKLIWGILIFICTFVLGFYFSFNYCSVLYNSKGIFIGTFLFSVLMDLIVYESFLNGLLTLFYHKRKFESSYNKHYYRLFEWRNYRCCV